MKKLTAFILVLALCVSTLSFGASAKTAAAGQTVDTVLFYLENAGGEEILVSRITVDEMVRDLEKGLIDSTNHNYSLLDRYTTTVHQEAKGFTVAEFVDYARSKSGIPALRELELSYAGEDAVAFWEIDQDGFDDMDTYTWNELYGTARYNFPLLYEYWNYRTQDYYDPAGQLSREEVIDLIFEGGESETVLLSVLAFSQRYMATAEKYGTGDYNMENLWHTSGLMDSQRTIRIMKPMTEAELRNKQPTASDTRYWVANIKLDMKNDPEIAPAGQVAAPTATMTEDNENYYISFDCATPGATIYYNHNFMSPSYTPCCEYSMGETVVVPKSYFPNGTVTMTCHAVKEGWTDAGVVTLELTASGEHSPWNNPYSDVNSGGWYLPYIAYVTDNGLFDPVGEGSFAPSAPMTRAMLATALYRMAGRPESAGIAATGFADVPADAPYAEAVAWCYEAGIVNGIDADSFGPDQSITRMQITAMFHRYAEKVAGADMAEADTLENFTDADALAPYAVDTTRWAVGAGLINGMTETTIEPKGTATRAQVAAMIMRLGAYAG